MREMIAVRAPALPAQVSGCSPRTAGHYQVARLARGGPSPRPCCGSPCARDVLRLSSLDARLGRRGPSPATSCGSHCVLGGRVRKGDEAPSEFDGMAILVTG